MPGTRSWRLLIPTRKTLDSATATVNGLMVRSYLFVPGDQPDKIDRAATRGADALIFDLEDAVLPARKADARQLVAAALAAPGDDAERWVRVNNHPDLMAADIAAVVRASPTGLVIPKVTDAQTIVSLVDRIEAAESSSDVASGSVAIMAMIEDGRGMVAMEAIAAAPRVRTMMIGEYDLAAELGVEPSEDGREFLFAHSKLVAACAAAEIEPPVAPVTAEFGDIEALRASTIRFRRMGYRGRALIHPAQVGAANQVFTPSESEVLEAMSIIERFEAGKSTGAGAVAQDGMLIDAPIVRAARRVLDTARHPADS